MLMVLVATAVVSGAVCLIVGWIIGYGDGVREGEDRRGADETVHCCREDEGYG